MKKTFFATTILVLGTLLLSGCMTTGPIVDDLNHYKKGDTYENLKEKNEEKEVVEEDAQESLEDTKAIENCINSRNNDPMLYEDESVIELHNQFENTEDFCTEFVKTNPMFYNDTIGVDESGAPIGQDGEIVENSEE